MTLDETVNAYCAAWNEKNEAARSSLLEQSWGDKGVYEDPMGVAPRAVKDCMAISAIFIRAIPARRSSRPARSTSITARSISRGNW